MRSEHGFSPDWVTPPGATVADFMQSRSISESELASRLACPPDLLARLLTGTAPVTLELADALAKVFGAPSGFWLRREEDYRDRLRALSGPSRQEWIGCLPTRDMRRWGWVPSSARGEELINECLRFFDVASPREWQSAYIEPGPRAAFSASSSYDGDPAATATWLRRGQLVAEARECAPLDRAGFESILPRLRRVTRLRDPEKFLPVLKRECAASGVAVVVERAPNGCRASGAVRTLVDRVLLLLSARFLSDDHFWFAFFHEAAHVVLHPEYETVVEWEDKGGLLEDEANEYASETLIPEVHRKEMRCLPAQHRAVVRFAVKVGIAPGVVVGQMQHERLIGFNQLNGLKARFRWESD